MSKRRSESHNTLRNFLCGNRLQQLEVCMCVSATFYQSRQPSCGILCIKQRQQLLSNWGEILIDRRYFLTKRQGGCYPYSCNSGEIILPTEYHVQLQQQTIPSTYWLPQAVAAKPCTKSCVGVVVLSVERTYTNQSKIHGLANSQSDAMTQLLNTQTKNTYNKEYKPLQKQIKLYFSQMFRPPFKDILDRN